MKLGFTMFDDRPSKRPTAWGTWLSACSAALLFVACGDAADMPGDELGDAAGLGVKESDLDLDAMSRWDSAALPEDEAQPAEHTRQKLRNATAVTYNDLIGNGVVQIRVRGVDCTAQVINKYFLLTAAHCIWDAEPGFYQRPLATRVMGVKRDGSRKIVFEGDAYGAIVPDAALGARDVALLILPGGISTCANSLAYCRDHAPDMPVNSVFQYWDLSVATPETMHPYVAVAYGPSDDFDDIGNPSDDVGLRAGQMAFRKFEFNRARLADGLSIHVYQGVRDHTRTCDGDSGSPLMTLNPGRPLVGWNIHMGILSGSTTSSCLTEGGVAVYAALDLPRVQWVAANLALFGSAYGFSCITLNMGSNVTGIYCGN